MWHFEECEEDTNIKSKSFQIKSTAHKKERIYFRTNNDLTDKNCLLDEPNNNKIYNITDKTVTGCGQYFININKNSNTR